MIKIEATFHKTTCIADDSGKGKDRLWFKDVWIKRSGQADLFIGSAMANKSNTLMIHRMVENQRYRMQFERIDKFNEFFPQLVNPSKVLPLQRYR